jgi:Ca-activated chloride channel family protein
MTQFTSFVAVEEMTVTVGGEPTTITVPVEMPDGVSYEGVFGEEMAGVLIKKAGAAGSGLSFGHQLRARGVPVRQPAAPPAVGGRSAGAVRLDAAQAGEETEVTATQPMEPREKLSEALRGLAEKVEKEGTDGNLTVGKLRVIDWKVDVMVFLADTSDETLAALRELGFVQSGESKAVRLLIGTIDVRKLEDLAKLEAVTRIKPVAS